jgi:hypothetical protein
MLLDNDSVLSYRDHLYTENLSSLPLILTKSITCSFSTL